MAKDGAVGVRTPPPATLLSASGSVVALLHTLFSASAFLLALGVGSWLHYKKIVQNEHWGYPEEWFPSVSATIGDWYPERNLFQVIIALTSGPRLLLILLLQLLHTSERGASKSLIMTVSVSGFIRTLACGGWVYVTSGNGDDALVHDAMMILYMVMNIPWMIGGVVLAKNSKRARTTVAVAFFATIGPLVYFYLQHKSDRVPGAYTRYAFFEWSLIVLDVVYDSLSISELAGVRVNIVAATGEEHEKKWLTFVPVSATSDVPPSIPAAVPQQSTYPRTIMSSVHSLSRTWRLYLSEIYLAFVFWTNLTAMGPMIFYQSVWSMGLSGDEIVLFSVLSPILLGSPPSPIYEFLRSHPIITHLITLGGIAAYKIDDEGWLRLRVMGGVGSMMTLGVVVEWWEARQQRGPQGIKTKATTFLLGLLLSVIAKFGNYSINPMWPFMADDRGGHMATGGHNGWGILIGAWAVCELWLSRHGDGDGDGVESPEVSSDAAGTTELPTSMSASFTASSALGALLFLLHFLFADSGTIIAWSWTGFPRTGPSAMPHGLFTILAMALGILSSTIKRAEKLALHPVSTVLAVGSSYVLYVYKDWLAFSAGLFVAFFAFNLFPTLLEAVTRYSRTPRWFGLAFLIYCILELASVWTVAYAFVPGGALLRERTGVVLAGIWVPITSGSLLIWRDKATSALEKGASVGIVGGARQSYRFKTVLALLLFSSIGVVWYRQPLGQPLPYHADQRVMTACIWTMHFGLDGRMWESQRRMRDIIRDAEIDVIGLLESDLQRIVMGNRDMTQLIASELNMYADIGPPPSSHTWGCALLSKFPIVNSTHHLLPSPNGELAPAIHATLNVYGVLVDIIVAHNGQEEDPLDRELQSRVLARLMREAQPRPVVFLGYVVTKPLAERPAPYQILVEEGEVADVDPMDDDRWCEYIFYRGLHRIGYARLNRGSNPAITDTELQLAKFVVPPANDPMLGTISSPSKDTNHRVSTQIVPPELRFPVVFYGDGIRGHRYHVLRDADSFAPLYYMSEEEESEKQQALVAHLNPEGCHQQ